MQKGAKQVGINRTRGRGRPVASCPLKTHQYHCRQSHRHPYHHHHQIHRLHLHQSHHFHNNHQKHHFSSHRHRHTYDSHLRRDHQLHCDIVTDIGHHHPPHCHHDHQGKTQCQIL